MSRAFWALLEGRWCDAVRLHPMVFSLPFLAAEFWCDGKPFRHTNANRALYMIIALGFLACYVMRLCGIWIVEI